jgi:hypothetical protein
MGNNTGVKIHSKFLKIFSRFSKPNSIKFGSNYPWMKRIQVCSNIKEQVLFKREIIKKIENWVGSFKNLLKNYGDRKLYMKTSLHRTKASWLKSWPPRVGWGKWKLNAFFIWKTISIWAKVSQVSVVAHGPLILKKKSSPEPSGQFQSNLVRIILG